MDKDPENEEYQPGQYAPLSDFPTKPNSPGDAAVMPPNEYNPQTGYQNENEEQKEIFNDEDAIITYSIRRGFIIKTYGILLTQLIITSGFICLSFVPSINTYMRDAVKGYSAFFICFLSLFLIVTIFVCVMFSCFRDRARRFPINYILLLSFTLCMSFYCTIFCALFDPQDVIVAAIVTTAATIGLTIYAIKTKEDFSYLGGLLFCFIFIVACTIGFFFWVQLLAIWIALGVLVYSLYIIYDTQLIIGNVGIEYNIDDYCFAALNLYIDIIYLFLRILQLIALLKGTN